MLEFFGNLFGNKPVKIKPPQGGSGTSPVQRTASPEVFGLLRRVKELEKALCEAKQDAEYQRQKVTTLRFDLAKLREAAAARDAQLADLLERNKSLVRENEHLKHPD